MNVLVINCGSSSVKYQVLVSESGEALAEGKAERVGASGRPYAATLKAILEAVVQWPIEAVGHRVVHGGERFFDAAAIDDEVEAAIEACIPLAPLHNPANLAGIRAARSILPDVMHVAVFDTAFHARLPRRSGFPRSGSPA